MENHLQKSVAYSMETEVEMISLLPELLVDLWAMGSSPQIVVDLLRQLDLTASTTRLLDLGCGKGAVAVTVAHQLGFRADGIDACLPFLEEAQKKAREYGVQHLCHFVERDIRKLAVREADYNVVVYASLGDILGPFKEITAKLRQIVRRGGYMIIDDGFFKPGKKAKRRGYDHYLSHIATQRALTAHGDILLREVITDEESKIINNEYLESMRLRAAETIKKYPQQQASIEAYIQSQEEECAFLEDHISGAIWLLKCTG